MSAASRRPHVFGACHPSTQNEAPYDALGVSGVWLMGDCASAMVGAAQRESERDASIAPSSTRTVQASARFQLVRFGAPTR